MVWPYRTKRFRHYFCSRACFRSPEYRTRRFWERVDKSGECWLWTGFRDKGGYGRVGHEGRSVLAHRFAYEIAVGPIPDGLDVLHSCDNPPCVNPAHLRAGTPSDNFADMVSRNRWEKPCGERHGMSKLTVESVRDIRARFSASRPSITAVGREFGVSKDTILSVILRRTWKQVA